MLVFNLIPFVGEAVEMVVHRAVEGHWAHSAEHEDERFGVDEHGCSPTSHICHCCPSQAAVDDERLVASSPLTPVSPAMAPDAVPDVWLEPPFRPPIS